MSAALQVKRIVANIEGADVAAARRFYGDALGLTLLMDFGWITTFGSANPMPVQVSIAAQGGSNTPTPALSIEVDDLDAALARMQEGGSPSNMGRRTSHGACGGFSSAIPTERWSIFWRTQAPDRGLLLA